MKTTWIAIGAGLLLITSYTSTADEKDKKKECKKCECAIRECDFEPLICAIDNLDWRDFGCKKDKARDRWEDLADWAEDAEEQAHDCDKDDVLHKLEKIIRRIDGQDCDDWLDGEVADNLAAIIVELVECLHSKDSIECPHQSDDKRDCDKEDKDKKDKCRKCGEKHDKDKDCKHRK
jgi:hypothetical protein